MRTRMVWAGPATLAAGTLLGWLAAVGPLPPAVVAQEKKSEPTGGNVPTFTPAQLAERSLHRRAVEAVIWGMPAVNYDLMYQAMIRDAKAGAGSNKIVFWSRLS